MKKYLVEFIGTLFLAFTVGAVAVYDSLPAKDGLNLAPLAIGLVLMVMTYAGNHVSGAHYNPAVTIGAFIRGRCNGNDVAPYIISQLLAAFVGGTAASVVTGVPSAPVISFENSGAVLLAEFLFTFALVFVFLNSTTETTKAGNSFYGLAIGGTVAAGILTVGSISFSVFNPAMSLMLALAGKLDWVDTWMHFLPQILGGLAAAFAVKAICPDDK